MIDIDNLLSIEMLEFVVLWHVAPEDLGKLCNFGCLLQNHDKASCVLLQLFGLDFLICGQEVDRALQLLNDFTSLAIFSDLVRTQIV